jgi:hypothetical protein
MKKLLTVLVFASVAYLFPNSSVVAQPASSFKVLDMPGFPDLPADSAFEGQSYSFTAVISNGTNFQLNGILELVFRVDTVETVVFTTPTTTVQAGDSISITVSQYSFTQQLYQAGNNIVVVWPRISGASPQTDTLYANVYFVPLSSVGFPMEDNSQWINVFPNPAQEWTTIGIPEKESVEYVRILDVSGKLIREFVAPESNRIHTGQLAPGAYFIQALSQKKVYRSSFIRIR